MFVSSMKNSNLQVSMSNSEYCAQENVFIIIFLNNFPHSQMSSFQKWLLNCIANRKPEKTLLLSYSSKINSRLIAINSTIIKSNLESLPFSSSFFLTDLTSLKTFVMSKTELIIGIPRFSKTIAAPVQVSDNGNMLDIDYNLRGNEIRAIAGSWPPWLSLKDCNDRGQK